MADFPGNNVSGLPANALGGGAVLLAGAVLGAGSPAASVHYKLRAHRTSDNTWQVWLATAIDLTAAPGGAANFDAASLTVQGKFTS